jgi:hypothetical protein
MSIESTARRLGGLCAAGGGSFQPLSEEEIRSVENQIGIRLPQSYRSLLGQLGAFTFKGRSDDNPFVFFTAKAELPSYVTTEGLSIIRSFYGKTQQAGPSGLQQQINVFQGRIPETMIPIAGDGGAGQICLGIKGDDLGKVFYWDMANEPLDEETYLEDYGEPMPAEAKRQNVHLVADSFDEFLDQLVLGPET